MAKLFNRAIRVQVQDRILQGLAVEFRIDRSLKSEPNTADLTIYNLSPENRAFLQEFQKPIVEIRAGYEGRDPTNPESSQPTEGVPSTELPVIYLGEMREVTNLREGSNWLTRITTGDGDEALHSPIDFSFGPGTTLQNAMKKMLEDAGVGFGNAIEALKKGKFQEAGTQFINGMVGSGKANEEIAKLARSAGLEYSIQNGEAQFLPIGQTLNNEAVLLTPATGLIGSPELGKDTTKKPVLKLRSLLNAQIFPGRLVKVESESINAYFRVDRAVYQGHNHGLEYYVDCECRAVG